MVYTADTLALALVEIMVSLIDYDDLRRYVFFCVDVPADAVETLPVDALPEDWDARPPRDPTQDLGDVWCKEQRSLALEIPSVVVPYSSNVILNPQHPAMEAVQIHQPETFPVDERLIRGGSLSPHAGRQTVE